MVGYLLEWRPENDKSHFLGSAGYTVAHADQLVADIRTQLLPVEAMLEETTDYGNKYRIIGALVGPNGRRLRVESIWMVEAASGATKFITLYPTKGV